jgi:NitT/TauT family transport system ATP-binding protein
VRYIQTNNLRVVYHSLKGGTITALDGFDLDARGGEFVSVIGPSGCGKTTFLKTVGGLVKKTSGLVEIDGQDVKGPGRDRAFVFQEHALLPWLTAQGNVAFGLSLAKLPDNEVEHRIRYWLERVGLTGFEDHYPHELSQGMRQRVGIARAFVMNPDILLMDEPFASVDAQTRESLQGELLRIWSEERKTVLFVTHSIEEAIFLSDKVVLMTHRPGKTKATFRIDLPRPRDYSTRATRSFQNLRLRIWQQLTDTPKRETPGSSMGGTP